MHSDEVPENVSAIVFPNFISIHRGYCKSIRSTLQRHRPYWGYVINVLCAYSFHYRAQPIDNIQQESFLIKAVVHIQTYKIKSYPQPRQILFPYNLRRVLQHRRRSVLLIIATQMEMVVLLQNVLSRTCKQTDKISHYIYLGVTFHCCAFLLYTCHLQAVYFLNANKYVVSFYLRHFRFMTIYLYNIIRIKPTNFKKIKVALHYW
jgi:uncharacterized protein with PQ loop repeat